MDKDNICTGMPIYATMEKINGKYVVVEESDFTKRVDIPADVIARFLLEKSGITPIYKGGGSE